MYESPQRGTLIILGVFVLLAILLSFSFLGKALAAGPNNYTKSDPAAKWSCFKKDDKGNLLVNKTTGLLTPCPIDTGDNAWMLTSSALVLMTDSWWIGNLLQRSYKTEECSQYSHDGFHNNRNNRNTMGIMGI